MKYDDDTLERALQALPLEEPPPDLHARILSATINQPQPVFRPWELWIVGGGLAVATWLIMAILGVPFAYGQVVVGGIGAALQFGAQALIVAIKPPSVLWLGVGVLAVFGALAAQRTLERVPSTDS